MSLVQRTAEGPLSEEETDNSSDENHQAHQIFPSVAAFAAQCIQCLKWRMIPSKEQFEAIREQVLDKPFKCSAAHVLKYLAKVKLIFHKRMEEYGRWKGSTLLDPPLGWERLLSFRSLGGARFADVYYITPSGKRLRSRVDVQRYLHEHPDDQDFPSRRPYPCRITLRANQCGSSRKYYYKS